MRKMKMLRRSGALMLAILATFRLGRLAALAALVGLSLATISVVDASAAAQPDGCPTDKPMVVDSWGTYRNAAEYAADGHVWALNSGTFSIRIWQIGTGAFCVNRRWSGTFTSFAGASPELTGTIPSGVAGTFEGSRYLHSFTTFAPKVPTTGFIGDFDAQCQQDGTCLGVVPSVKDLYFSPVRHADFGVYSFTYDGGACGTLVVSSEGNAGDIVC